MAFASARKLYRMVLLSTHKGGNLGTNSVTERSGAAPILRRESSWWCTRCEQAFRPPEDRGLKPTKTEVNIPFRLEHQTIWANHSSTMFDVCERLVPVLCPFWSIILTKAELVQLPPLDLLIIFNTPFPPHTHTTTTTTTTPPPYTIDVSIIYCKDYITLLQGSPGDCQLSYRTVSKYRLFETVIDVAASYVFS